MTEEKDRMMDDVLEQKRNPTSIEQALDGTPPNVQADSEPINRSSTNGGAQNGPPLPEGTESADSQGNIDTIPKYVDDRTPDGTDDEEANDQFEEEEDEKLETENDGDTDVDDQIQQRAVAEARAQLAIKSAINKRMKWLLVNRPDPTEPIICRKCSKAMRTDRSVLKNVELTTIAHASSHCPIPLYSCLQCPYVIGYLSDIHRHLQRRDHNITKRSGKRSGKRFVENYSDELYRTIEECYGDEIETGDSTVISSNGDGASGGGDVEELDRSENESDDRRATMEAPKMAKADDEVSRLRAELSVALARCRDAESELATSKIENSRLDNALTESKAEREKAEIERQKVEAERDELNEQLRDMKAKSLGPEERRRLEQELDEAKNEEAILRFTQYVKAKVTPLVATIAKLQAKPAQK